MATIPDVGDLGARPALDARRPIIEDRSGAILAEGVADVSRAITQRVEREDKFSYAKARSALLSADLKAREDLSEDQDWATFGERYKTQVDKAYGEAAKLIRSPLDRRAFEMEAQSDMQRGAFEVRKMARAREGDEALADLDTLLNSTREIGLNAKDEKTRMAALDTANDAVTGIVERGFLDKDKAQQLRTEFSAKYAAGYAATLSAPERVKFLSNPKDSIAQYIPTDVRAQMLESAKKEGEEVRVRGAAQSIEDQAMTRFAGNEAAAMKWVRETTKGDPLVRDRAVTLVQGRFGEADHLRAEADRARVDDISAKINAGTHPHAIDPTEWAKLSTPQQEGFEQRYRDVKAGIEPVTNPMVRSDWDSKTPLEMSAENPYDPKWRNHLNNRDWEEVRQNWLDSKDPTKHAKLEGIKSEQEFIDGALVTSGAFTKTKGLKPGSEESNRYLRITNDIDSAVLRSGAATDAQKREVINEVIRNHVYESNMFGKGPALFPRLETLTPEQMKRATTKFKEIPPEHVQMLREQAQKFGRTLQGAASIPEEDIERAYAAMILGDDATLEAILKGEQ